MKRSAIITTTFLAGFMAMGVAGKSSAMVKNGAFELHDGNTPSRMIPSVDHYHIEVEHPSQLRVASQLWSPEGAGGRMKATLRDDSGKVVSRSDARGKDFILEQSLAPGHYTLEVHGSPLTGRQESTQRYYLTTDIR